MVLELVPVVQELVPRLSPRKSATASSPNDQRSAAPPNCEAPPNFQREFPTYCQKT
jgi:hypothetical protein